MFNFVRDMPQESQKIRGQPNRYCRAAGLDLAAEMVAGLPYRKADIIDFRAL
jgi:hypothetical protein